MLIDERPIRIIFGIVRQRKRLLYTVFLVDQRRLIDVMRRILRYLHQLRDIIAYLVRTEIQRRQMRVAVRHDESSADQCAYGGDDLRQRAPGRLDRFAANQQHDGQRQENDVLPERLPVRHHQRVTEATAVAHGVRQRDPQRQRRHHQIEQQRQPTRPISPHVEQHRPTEQPLNQYQTHRCCTCQRQQVRRKTTESFQIVLDLIHRAQRINRLHEAREQERDRQQRPRDASYDMFHFIHCNVSNQISHN